MKTHAISKLVSLVQKRGSSIYVLSNNVHRFFACTRYTVRKCTHICKANTSVCFCTYLCIWHSHHWFLLLTVFRFLKMLEKNKPNLYFKNFYLCFLYVLVFQISKRLFFFTFYLRNCWACISVGEKYTESPYDILTASTTLQLLQTLPVRYTCCVGSLSKQVKSIIRSPLCLFSNDYDYFQIKKNSIITPK